MERPREGWALVRLYELARDLSSSDVLTAMTKTAIAGVTSLEFIGFDIVANRTVAANMVDATIDGIVGIDLLTRHAYLLLRGKRIEKARQSYAAPSSSAMFQTWS